MTKPNFAVPESIYPKYSIIEKQVLGETCYCAVREFKIWKFTLKVRMNTYDGPWGNHRFDSSYGRRWHFDKKVITEAIAKKHSEFRDEYIEKALR